MVCRDEMVRGPSFALGGFLGSGVSSGRYSSEDKMVCVCVNCSVVSDSMTPWTVTRQAPLSMVFPRDQSGLPPWGQALSCLGHQGRWSSHKAPRCRLTATLALSRSVSVPQPKLPGQREGSIQVFWKILSPFFSLLMFSILPA